MRRLLVLALAALALPGPGRGARGAEHVPAPNVEFNLTLAVADTSAPGAPGTPGGAAEWATAYDNTNGTAGERGTPGAGWPALVRNGSAPYPSLRLPGGVRAAYLYGRPEGVARVLFRYAGEETGVDVDPAAAAAHKEEPFAAVTDLAWFRRTPEGEYSNVEVRLEGPGGGPVAAGARPALERVVVTTGIQSQG